MASPCLFVSETTYGFTGDFYDPSTYKDHHYPHMLAEGDPNEALGTLGHHDHRIDFTAANTYKGLAGPFLLFDEPYP